MRPLALLVAGGLALAGCGGSADEDAVRDALTEYTQAMAGRDGEAACSRMTDALQEFLMNAFPNARDCPAAVAAATRDTPAGDVSIEGVEVDGDTATATVDAGTRQTLRKVEGRWRVDVSPTEG